MAIARALANEPPLILADEPTGNLDSQASNQVVALLQQLTADGQRTVVIVTHNPAVTDICDFVVEMRDGRVAKTSTSA